MPTPHRTVPADSPVPMLLENITRKGEGKQHRKHDLFEALQNLCKHNRIKSLYLVAFPLSLQKTINTDYNCASSQENLTVACEQQRCRSACAFAQSDQHLCCSPSDKYNNKTCNMQSFIILASFYSSQYRFGYYLDGTPKTGFLASRSLAQSL